MERNITCSVNLECASKEAFEMFTVNKKLVEWLCPAADVEPVVGGKYELFWNPEDKEHDSTVGCEITALVEGRYLSFEWKGPRQFAHFMNEAEPLTQVTVFFVPCEGPSLSTDVSLVHSGWGDSKEWDEARKWFERAWTSAFKELKSKAPSAAYEQGQK